MIKEELLSQVKRAPDTLEFSQVMDVINNSYHYSPSQFSNGDLVNKAGTNEGSCKILSFAKMQQLTEAETLALFGSYYRNDVLGNPDGTDHGNIRNFIKHGWSGVDFNGVVLTPKLS